MCMYVCAYVCVRENIDRFFHRAIQSFGPVFHIFVVVGTNQSVDICGVRRAFYITIFGALKNRT